MAVAGGLVWAACFGRRPLLLAPWIALVPLLLLLGHRRGPLLAFLHGLAGWLAAIPWIAHTVKTYGGLPGWLAVLVLLLLATYLALFQLLFARLGAGAWRRGGAAALLGLPALWVALEWLRSHLFGGFAWNLAAYAWAEAAGALPLTAWIGPFGLSFLVLLANTGIARSVAERRLGPAAWTVGVCLLLLSWGGRWAGPAPAYRAGDSLPVRVVQPAIPNQVEWDPALALEGYGKLMRMSARACDRPGALLIWPESAAWPFTYGETAAFREDVRELTARGCSLLLNTTSREGGRSFNSALMVERGEVAGRYDKRHLVPWGEYVPLERWLPFIGKLARAAGSYSPGEGVRLLPFRGERLGTSICFEVTFPGETAALVRAGATLLVTITNDAWFGDSAAPWQHFRAARFRAAENRRPVLRAAVTGVSGVIEADGSVSELLGLMEEGVLAAEVAGRSELSPYARFPWLVPALCSLLAASVIFSRSRRRR